MASLILGNLQKGKSKERVEPDIATGGIWGLRGRAAKIMTDIIQENITLLTIKAST